MWCPFCSSDDTRVIDSRMADGGSTVRRRRECQSCQERFTTFERPQLRLPQVIKSDGRRETFDEEKLRGGVHRALEKRAIHTDVIESAINRIVHKLTVSGARETPSKQIGEAVMHELGQLDDVAYVRFASVYRQFQDLEAFSEEVARLRNQLSDEVRKRQMSLIPDDGDSDA